MAKMQHACMSRHAYPVLVASSVYPILVPAVGAIAPRGKAL